MKPNGNDYPKDMNFTGNMEVLLNPDGVSNAQNLNVFCVPSGYNLDETNFGDSGVINNADLNGFPSEFGSDLQEVKNQFFQIEIGDLGIPEGLFSFEIDRLDQYINFIFALSSPFFTSMSLENENNLSNRFISYLYPQYGLNSNGISGFGLEFENIFKNYERSFDEFLPELAVEAFSTRFIIDALLGSPPPPKIPLVSELPPAK